jgi:hypothetical protein
VGIFELRLQLSDPVGNIVINRASFGVALWWAGHSPNTPGFVGDRIGELSQQEERKDAHRTNGVLVFPFLLSIVLVLGLTMVGMGVTIGARDKVKGKVVRPYPARSTELGSKTYNAHYNTSISICRPSRPGAFCIQLGGTKMTKEYGGIMSKGVHAELERMVNEAYYRAMLRVAPGMVSAIYELVEAGEDVGDIRYWATTIPLADMFFVTAIEAVASYIISMQDVGAQ